MNKTWIFLGAISLLTQLSAQDQERHGPSCSCGICSIPLGVDEWEGEFRKEVSYDNEQDRDVDSSHENAQEQYQSCQPCCKPEPPKCIDCECYTPMYYDLQCACGVFFDIEFLYWYGRESNLGYATKGETIPFLVADPAVFAINTENAFAPSEVLTFGTSWRPGVRVGLGMNSGCDGWDYYLNWTWYKNSRSDSKSVANTTNAEAPALGGTALGAFGTPNLISNIFLYNKANAKWEFLLNQLDLELGRRYWLSKCFTLRPYVGLRAAWTRTKFKTSLTRDSHRIEPALNGDDRTISTSTDSTNRFWGVGFTGGLQPNWYFTRCVSLFANADFSLLWGEKKEKVDAVLFQELLRFGNFRNRTDFQPSHRFNQYTMQGILDLALGLRYENRFCNDRYMLSFDLGWEHHLWLDHTERSFINSSDNTTVVSESERTKVFTNLSYSENDVMFGGFVLRARFDF